ncbi:E3 ubiquitin protein ligase RIN2-like isoform X1 [Typha angustifolia]|uniref:E3 ubiquitin protein ligase RIN2-like isoform X1 n=1 Tax=Typha angustifolia TaxID=59011 RepID=UPI003C2DA2FC
MAVNYLYVSAVSTAVSLAGLQWWAVTFLDGVKSDGLTVGNEDGGLGRPGRSLELLLGSRVTAALLVIVAINVFMLVVLSLKSLFFVELHPSEVRKVLERIINYAIYKGTFLPLVVPPNVLQVGLWSTWLTFLCSLKMFQSLARDRLEQLNASPSATPLKYLRVYSALLLVLIADLLWIKPYVKIHRTFNSSLFVLLLFEPLSIAFETLQAIMVHGFQLFDIWQRHLVDSGGDCFNFQTSYKKVAGFAVKEGSRGIAEWLLKGSLSEWRGILIRDFGFVLDMMTLLTALGHYLMIWWLRGMAFHLLDAVLFLNLRALLSAIVKRIRTYVKLKKALNSLDGALPDASYEELSAYDDECAICRGPMARAKKLSCNHLFHLACLRSWLDQGLTDVYSCPTCRRPLFVSTPQRRTSSIVEEAVSDEQLAEQFNVGLNQQRISGHALPVGGAFPDHQQNRSDAVWRGAALDSWSNSGSDGAGSSSAFRSVGLSGVQMMVRQFASVNDNYAHADAAWNLWPPQLASGSTLGTSSLRYNRNTAGLRIRNPSPSVNGNTTEVLSMVDRVREVLPHIPDEIIIQDLLRTNNINITVNNLLLVQ